MIDGDILTYRMGFAADAQAKRDAGDDWHSLEYLDWALHLIDNVIGDITTTFQGDNTMWLYLSGKTNFRDDVAKLLPYKGNRDPANKPKYYKELREYMVERYGAIMSEGEEADDLLGIHQFSQPNKSTVICTIDKDLNMIPGYHFNFAKGELFDIKLPEADIFFFRQVLTGDATDNIPGIRGTGPKTAEKLIGNGCSAEDAYAIIGRAYKASYKDTASEAVSEIARLLWIRRQKEEVCPHAERLAAACLNG